MSIELAGSIGLPHTQEKSWLSRPKAEPKIAGGYLEAVIVDVTRPVEKEFQVRIYDEDFRPPDAQVKAAFVFYGIGMPAVVKALEDAWSRRKIEPVGSLPGGSMRSYDFSGGLHGVVESIESVQQKHMPK